MIESFLLFTCDGCGTTFDHPIPNTSRERAREIAKLELRWGWIGRLDYCPTCVNKGKLKERKSIFDK